MTDCRRCQTLPMLLSLVLAVTGCASLRPGYETPTVTVSSFRALPSDGGIPAFEIGLRVINPNPEALTLRGVSYTVSLEGYELIKGVAGDLPVIEAYSEGQFNLTASASLLAGIRLLTDLMSSPRDDFGYAFEARLDTGALWPDIRVGDSGRVSLRPPSPN